jgi:hypothetical protein
LAGGRGQDALTHARAVSYWAEYYRSRFAHVDAYPAIRALRTIERELR